MRIAWNKGLTKEDPRVLKYAQKNRFFKVGQSPWNKGKQYLAPWLDPFRFGNREKPVHKRMEKYTEEERIKIWGKSRRGKQITEEHKNALLQAPNRRNTGNNHTQETRKRMSEAQKRIMTPEHIKKCLRHSGKSSLEKAFEKIVQDHKLPYVFTGDGQMIIGRKCPDFVNTNGEKIAIEVFYKRHKEFTHGGLDKWKKDRTLIFRKYGWKLLFFDETMVNENDVIQAIS